MISVSLDTSCGFSFAVAMRDRVVINHGKPAAARHGATVAMAETVKTLLQDQDINVGMITRWTVGVGPGSFAGLRMGIAFVAGICMQTAAAYRGLPSSFAVAASAADEVAADSLVGVLNDARQGQIIATVYRKNGDLMVLEQPAAVFDPEQLDASLADCPVLVSVQPEAVHRLLSAPLTERLLARNTVDAATFLMNPDWPADLKAREDSVAPVYVRPAVFVKPSGAGNKQI